MAKDNLPLLEKEPKKNKYNAVKTVLDGVEYHSKGESTRAGVLKYQVSIGLIYDLREQVKYPLLVNGTKIGDYIADFVYIQDNREIVEDFKGVRTDMYKWKAKHMLAQYGIKILETGKKKVKKHAKAK
jgi:hypothetical protein